MNTLQVKKYYHLLTKDSGKARDSSNQQTQ